MNKWIAVQDQMPIGAQFVWVLTSREEGFPIVAWTDGEHFYAPLLEDAAPQYADGLFAFWAPLGVFAVV